MQDDDQARSRGDLLRSIDPIEALYAANRQAFYSSAADDLHGHGRFQPGRERRQVGNHDDDGESGDQDRGQATEENHRAATAHRQREGQPAQPAGESEVGEPQADEDEPRQGDDLDDRDGVQLRLRRSDVRAYQGDVQARPGHVDAEPDR